MKKTFNAKALKSTLKMLWKLCGSKVIKIPIRILKSYDFTIRILTES
jgi:hypothetical protein